MIRSKGRTVLAALAAVFALAAVASASASAALPEFSPGAKESFPASFEGKGGSATWYLPNGGSWTCTSSSMSGSVSAAKTVSGVTILFTECRYQNGEGGTNRCTTEGLKEGEIETKTLEGTLVYRSKTSKTVGVVFKPQTGTSLGSFKCQGATGEIRGSILMPITTVNKLETHFTLSSTQGSKEYENEKGEKQTAKLETDWPSSFGPLSWEMTDELVTSKKLEIKA